MTMATVAVLGSAALSYYGGQQSAHAAQQANQQNIAFQQQMFQLQDPFSAGGNRAQYVGQLNQLVKGGYAGLANDPMLQKLENFGLQRTQRAMASQGMGLSSNDILAINQNQTGTMMDYYNQQFSRLAQLSGESGGRTAPIQGMSPATAYSINMGKYSNMAAGFGGLASIYGGGQGGQGGTVDQFSNMYDMTTNAGVP